MAGKDVIYFFGQCDTEKIEYGLSNFTDLDVKIPKRYGFFPWAEEDLIFPNSEAAFQAFKCHTDETQVRKFMECDNPKSAKAKGRRVQLRPDWEEVKVKWMYIVLWCKFSTRKELLFKTGSAKLLENSPFDKFWGIGKKKDGKNVTGRLLMLVRGQLQAEEKVDLINFDPTEFIFKE